ncbi:hydroxyphenylacetyl-CoA thioesterase PaaI [Sneathiella chinensis]|uniref:Phenylacetic acid degradation protein PaaD n=1 Tax=Sneathiella chinensis TaxID=349750 RepID=A0ABQ5U7E0_9PROT|nr:hydroxyphenylacetyl-CoA thioesterase PaaI [Sneathiella chinensis]GLQ07128.1 phenylacetic acid degradation protein PaaD [Sneathiella chinensis]
MPHDHPTTDPQALAETVAAAMYERDNTARHLGMVLTHVTPGRATMTMPVADHMLNGHNTCHGGYIFTFADTVFAYACNSYNQNTVAQGAQITYIRPVAPKSLLSATAIEVSRTGRTGVYDITVTDQTGTTVALFRGNSHTIKGQMVPDPNSK